MKTAIKTELSPSSSTLQGLTEQEALARRQQGLGNNVNIGSSRSYWDIARANLFTLFNNILFVIGVALISLGRVNDAVTSVGIGLVNACISTIQEIRAKRQLDQIALVARPEVTVVRDGQEKIIDPAELVKGDIIRVSSGDQVVVDGELLEGALEMDESLLTGEPDLIRKQVGDGLLSGSFCVTGSGYYEAQKVGGESFANQLTMTARDFQVVYTPLQRKVDFVVRMVMMVVVIMSIIILVTGLFEGLSTVRLVQIAAVLSGQVPYGLFLMIVVAYALGASTIAKQGALVQQVNAIESLSNIDVLCTDKTGTLTANRLQFNALYPLNGTPAKTIENQLGDFVRSAATTNKTSEAIMASLPGQQRAPADEIPFASARKWSALAFDQPERHGVYVLGAVEMLQKYLPPAAAAGASTLSRQVQTWSDQGLRVLLFAYNPQITTLHNGQAEPKLPPLTPLAVVSLSDELRPQTKETITAFKQLGVELKVISGDNPQTVAALAKQVGFPPDVKLVSGPQLAEMSPAEFAQAADEASIFGRISPEQKEKLVDALLRQGKRVAMMGDGVNDVLSLKKASLGIAMESGSSATRNVADMILLKDSFAALRPAFNEGRRIIGGMSSALLLFLARVTSTTLIIIAVTMTGISFPFDPAQVALTTFTVGIPAFFLTLWARPQVLRRDILSLVARFVFPVSILNMLFGVAIYAWDYFRALEGLSQPDIPDRAKFMFESYTGVAFGTEEFGSAAATIAAQGSLSIFISCTAFLLILFLEPPFPFFLGWRRNVSHDKRPAFLVLGLFILFQIIYFEPLLGSYFGILHKPSGTYFSILGLVIVWFFLIRTVWRAQIFERFLGLDKDSPG
ncbi:MAG: HAD-IC family P-type ATPase [Anaerolineaceae bacterium]|nr:HAD-IC family P-type ATPase [Anaerolineaceae bacterium]MCB9100894.1 HAD-IC family P-type ATPase [Anaerolineales bacterium]